MQLSPFFNQPSPPPQKKTIVFYKIYTPKFDERMKLCNMVCLPCLSALRYLTFKSVIGPVKTWEIMLCIRTFLYIKHSMSKTEFRVLFKRAGIRIFEMWNPDLYCSLDSDKKTPKNYVDMFNVVPSGLNPNGIEPNGIEPTELNPHEIEPNGIEPTELDPRNWTHGIAPTRDCTHGIKPARDWTRTGLNPCPPPLSSLVGIFISIFFRPLKKLLFLRLP